MADLKKKNELSERERTRRGNEKVKKRKRQKESFVKNVKRRQS